MIKETWCIQSVESVLDIVVTYIKDKIGKEKIEYFFEEGETEDIALNNVMRMLNAIIGLTLHVKETT